jgi:hypothetical protein
MLFVVKTNMKIICIKRNIKPEFKGKFAVFLDEDPDKLTLGNMFKQGNKEYKHLVSLDHGFNIKRVYDGVNQKACKDILKLADGSRKFSDVVKLFDKKFLG